MLARSHHSCRICSSILCHPAASWEFPGEGIAARFTILGSQSEIFDLCKFSRKDPLLSFVRWFGSKIKFFC